MELSIIIPHIEALIFASEKPLTGLDLVELVNNALGFIEHRATLDQVESGVEAIKDKYSSEFYPFELKESGGGLQFLTKPAYYKTVAQLNGDKFLKKLSSAAMETLAIIAYKQPITKGEIESIRGVNCDYAVQKLLEKDLVIITGRKENAPGQPLIYATSNTFMDYFGINSADELPKLSDIAQEAVDATSVTGLNPVDGDLVMEDDDKNLIVDEFGNMEEVLPLGGATEAEEPTNDSDVAQTVGSQQNGAIEENPSEDLGAEFGGEEPAVESERVSENDEDDANVPATVEPQQNGAIEENPSEDLGAEYGDDASAIENESVADDTAAETDEIISSEAEKNNTTADNEQIEDEIKPEDGDASNGDEPKKDEKA